MRKSLPCTTLFTLITAAALGLACDKKSESAGPSDPAATPAASPADSPAPSTEPAPSSETIAWQEMTGEQKAEHMKKVVTPTMAAVFRDFSADHYKEFNCMTCHGPGAKEGKFAMPTDGIPPLVDFATANKEHPEVTKFMAQKVVPEMARTIGLQPYDPATNQGFGCFNCHQKKS